MPDASHTFLFEPGIWTAGGTFWSEDGRAMSAEGLTEIRHEASCWVLAGTLKVHCSPPVEFVNVYEIAPPAAGQLTVKWTSENPALGRLHGTFTAVGPALLSVFRAERDGYHGVESLAWQNPHHYEAYGVLLMQDRRISSWRMALRREGLNRPR